MTAFALLSKATAIVALGILVGNVTASLTPLAVFDTTAPRATVTPLPRAMKFLVTVPTGGATPSEYCVTLRRLSISGDTSYARNSTHCSPAASIFVPHREEDSSFEYNVFVKYESGNRSRSSVTGHVSTQPRAPDHSPQRLQLTARTSSTITISWASLDHLFLNGRFVEYNIQYSIQGSASTTTILQNKTSATIASLNPSTTYVISVAVTSAGGTGPARQMIISTISASSDACGACSCGKVPRGTKVECEEFELTEFPTLFPSDTFKMFFGLNQLTSIPAGVFDGLSRVEQMDFSHNQLTTLPSGIFNNQRELLRLNLADNMLSVLPPLEHHPKLVALVCLNNMLTQLQAGMFSNNPDLQHLALADNLIAIMPIDIFKNLTKLRSLYLGNNQLTTLQAGIFQNLTELRFLGLQGNNLTDLRKNLFSSLANLVTLQLQNNKLTSIHQNQFAGLEDLAFLDLANNMIPHLPSKIGLLPRLDTLVSFPNRIAGNDLCFYAEFRKFSTGSASTVQVTGIDNILSTCRGASVTCFKSSDVPDYACRCPNRQGYNGTHCVAQSDSPNPVCGWSGPNSTPVCSCPSRYRLVNHFCKI